MPYPKKEKADDESAVADSSPLPKRKTGPCQRQVNLDFASFAAFPSHTLPSHELKINRINRMDFKNKTLVQKIIGCAFNVYSNLGKGFLENECNN